MRLFGRKDEELFMLFNESARVVVRGGAILEEIVNNYTDLDIKMAKLTALEHEGDRIMEDLVRHLNTSFILPFDKEDALLLAQQLAATMDWVTGIIDRIVLYKAGEPDDRVKEMVQVLCKSLQLQQDAFCLLGKLERNKKQILRICDEIEKLEKEQDCLYRTGVANLFENEADPIAIIKWREVYEHIETAQDYTQDVGELLANICVKYS